MTRWWVHRLGGRLVDAAAVEARAEAQRLALVARGVEPSRAAEQAARNAVSSALVALARGGDPDARAQLVEIWFDPVHRWCRIGARPGVQPDDVAHDALVRMIEGLDRLRDDDALYGWLWGMVWRLLRDHDRRARIRAWLPDLFGRPVEQEIHAAERTALVAEVLAALPLQERELLTMAYVEDLTREQIAQTLDLPLGTVNRRLTRAREAFRRRAQARGLDGCDEIAGLQEYA